MKLYALTHRRADAILHLAKGTFTYIPKKDDDDDDNNNTPVQNKYGFEIVVSHANSIELIGTVPETNEFKTICRQDVFGTIRSIGTFRLLGGEFDYLVMATDSGKFNIYRYDMKENRFIIEISHAYGHVGCRRALAGELLAMDPAGRAIMCGAVERQKIVYGLTREEDVPLVLKSPLEANFQHSITFDIASLDIGFDNPTFASLELNYSEADEDHTGNAARNTQKFLIYYELDIGVNTVKRTWAEPTVRSANRLIPVPSGDKFERGPGGLLVLSNGFVTYQKPDHDILTARIPLRENNRTNASPAPPVIIVAYDTHIQASDGQFFFIVQSEHGDLYKITLNHQEHQVTMLNIYYFDSIPAANALCITRNGYLFVANESNDHFMYVFTSLGGKDSDACSKSVVYNDLTNEENLSLDLFMNKNCPYIYFKPRQLENLEVCEDSISSLAPILKMDIGDLQEKHGNQIYTLSGRGARSTLRVLEPGLDATQLALSVLPGFPINVWTLKDNIKSPYHKHIVLSFVDATLIMEVGNEGSIGESKNNDFVRNKKTVFIGETGLLEDRLGDYLQILPNAVRHIRGGNGNSSNSKPVEEIHFDGNQEILKVAMNRRQVALGLQGGILVYLEMDHETGSFNEVKRIELGASVTCLAMQEIPRGRQKTSYLAVGTNAEKVILYALDASRLLKVVSTENLDSAPNSLCLTNFSTVKTLQQNLILSVGQRNGVLLRFNVDKTSGEVTSDRERFLGTGAVALTETMIGGQKGVLALSPKPFILYQYDNKLCSSKLAYSRLTSVSSFSSEEVPEGFVAIEQNQLHFISNPEKLNNTFTENIINLKYTPRGMSVYPLSDRQVHYANNNSNNNNNNTEGGEEDDGDVPSQSVLLIIESDYNVNLNNNPFNAEHSIDNRYDDTMTPPEFDSEETDELLSEQVGYTRGTGSGWLSAMRVVNPISGKTRSFCPFGNNESAFTITSLVFESSNNSEPYIVVGTVANLSLTDGSHNGGKIHVYRLTDSKDFVLYHTTLIDDIPLAMAPYGGKILIAVGAKLRLYDLGKKKLLRKCQSHEFPTRIRTINPMGNRIFVGDMEESFHCLEYSFDTNMFGTLAFDKIPRFITCACPLDYNTIAGGDKFGSIFVLQVPDNVELIDFNLKQPENLWNAGTTRASFQKNNRLNSQAQFYIGQVVTSIVKKPLVMGGNEMLVYSTILGGIGTLMPFVLPKKVEFFETLERHLRKEVDFLSGWRHVAYRSYFAPVQHVIDGDLCELFGTLPFSKQKEIAEELDATPKEVLKYIDEMRTKCYV